MTQQIWRSYKDTDFSLLSAFSFSSVEKEGGGRRGGGKELHVQCTKYCARLPQDGTATQAFLFEKRSSSAEALLGRGITSSNFVTRLSPISHKTALAGRWIHFWLEQYIRYYDKFAVYLI